MIKQGEIVGAATVMGVLHVLADGAAAPPGTVLIRQGPWGYLWADDLATARAADWCIDRITELSELIKSG